MQKKRVFAGLVLLIAVLVGIYVFSHYNPEEAPFFPKCPVYLLTGYKCPGCGSQRAIYHLFHGNLTTAFKHNALMILLSPYVLFGIYFEYFSSKTCRWIVCLYNLLFSKWVLLALAIIIVLFTILRNIR